MQLPKALPRGKDIQPDQALRWRKERFPAYNAAFRWAIEQENVEHAYRMLSTKWESYLREAIHGQLQGGRGKLAMSNRRGPQPTHDRSTYIEEKWRRLRGQCVAAVRAEKQGRTAEMQDMVWRMRKQAAKLSQLDAAEVHRQINRGLTSCQEWLTEVWQTKRKEAATYRKKAWKEKMENKTMKDLAAALRLPREHPLTMLELEDESWLADPFLVLQEVRTAWSPIMEAGADQAEGIDTFLTGVPFVPFHQIPLSSAEVEAALENLKTRTAPGPDGWRPYEVAQLPKRQLAEDLCIFYELCERLLRWPAVWNRAWLCAVPKAGKRRSAKEVRPISLYSVFYRVWSSARSKQHNQWLQSVLAHPQSAFRQGRGAEQEASLLGQWMEKRSYSTWCGVTFDMAKAFDHVNHSLLKQVALRSGMSLQAWEVLASATLGQCKAWRLQTGQVGDWFVPARGVGQGCALSVAAFNLMLAPLIHALQTRWPEAQITSFADDLTLVTENTEAMQAMVTMVEDFLRGAGLVLNPSKCAYFVGGLCDFAPASVSVSGVYLTPVSSVDILGVGFRFPGGFDGLSTRMDAREHEAKRRIEALRRMPISAQQKTRAVTSMVIPLIAYGGWARRLTAAGTRSWRHRVLQGAHGKIAQGPRCAEVLLGAFGNLVAMDPKWAKGWRALQTFRITLASLPSTWELWDYYNRAGVGNKIGPVAEVYRMMKELGQ